MEGWSFEVNFCSNVPASAKYCMILKTRGRLLRPRFPCATALLRVSVDGPIERPGGISHQK